MVSGASGTGVVIGISGGVGVGIEEKRVGDVSVQGGLSFPGGPPESFWPGVLGELVFEAGPEGKEETKPPEPTAYKKKSPN